MAGIYIHIPFCRQACHYCDFHFSTNLSRKADMVNALCDEIRIRSPYLQAEVKTVYFGGGTPSLLSDSQLREIISCIQNHFQISSSVEVTLEANPEDMSKTYAEVLFHSGINRLSTGFQTFSDERLKWMNRAHSADQALLAFENSRAAGFKNISVDLIYAIPGHGTKGWQKDLEVATDLDPEHISIYGLTIEEDTVFGKWKEKEKLKEVDEDEAASQYTRTVEFLKQRGMPQYEVSNFAKKGFESKHNGAYWAGEPYLGIGPGAHSYNGKSRQFNVRNNAKYLNGMKDKIPHFEQEVLSTIQRMNEQILTRLRTTKGIDLSHFESAYQTDLMTQKKEVVSLLIDKGLLVGNQGFLTLTTQGFLVADEVALKLFFDE